MDAKVLRNAEKAAAVFLTQNLLKFVKENGTDITDEEKEQFGLYDEYEGKVTKILNFYEKEGCYSIMTKNCNPDLDPTFCKSADDILQKTDEEFLFTALECLYVVEDEEGVEELKFFCWWNDNMYFMDGLAESEHGFVKDLDLAEFSDIIKVIFNYHR